MKIHRYNPQRSTPEDRYSGMYKSNSGKWVPYSVLVEVQEANRLYFETIQRQYDEIEQLKKQLQGSLSNGK